MLDPRRRRALLMSLTAALLLLAVLPAAAAATHRGSDVVDETLLEVSYQPSSLPGVTPQLVAHVRAEGGSALVGVEVEFLREVEFLGSRRILLGRATTDAWGAASIPLNATTEHMTVLVRFAGNAAYQAVELSTDIVLAPPPVAPGIGSSAGEAGAASIAILAAVMPPVLALTAGAIWLLLLGMTIWTVRAIRRGRRQLREEAE
jgi:hypothetical protein